LKLWAGGRKGPCGNSKLGKGEFKNAAVGGKKEPQKGGSLQEPRQGQDFLDKEEIIAFWLRLSRKKGRPRIPRVRGEAQELVGSERKGGGRSVTNPKSNGETMQFRRLSC